MADEVRQLSRELQDALVILAEELPAHQARYALVGGIAAGLRGKLRYTEDIDFIITVPQLRLPSLLETLVARGFTCDIMATIREWNQSQMVVMDYGSVRVDWLKPIVPAYLHVVNTATKESWNGRDLCVATAEGIILTKMIASRDQDIADINVLLAANRGQLDMSWIEQEWNTLFDANDPRWLKYRQSLAEYYDFDR